ncbi:MAG: Tex family protein [Eubacteriales bacterium]|nr:Tex family protein [Eubacteriales bacterium]
MDKDTTRARAGQADAAESGAAETGRAGAGEPLNDAAQRVEKAIARTIAQELQVKPWQVEAAVSLIDEGNTIPFIARYRKEATGTLDDEQLRTLDERLSYLRNLEEKKAKVLETVAAQGQLTEELRAQIEAAQTQVAVEDLYRPFRPKRRTRAGIAKERGLQGLADWLLSPDADHPALEEARKYIDAEKEVPDAQTALQGARDILAEMISDNADYRTWIRECTAKDGFLVSAKKGSAGKGESARGTDGDGSSPDAASGNAAAGKTARKAAGKNAAKAEDRAEVYEMYFAYEEQMSRIPGHRVLAINRGEKEGYLTVRVDAPAEKIRHYLNRQVIRKHRGQVNPWTAPVLEEVCADSYDRLIGPAIEREIRSALTEKAEDGAIAVFKQNLEQLLMQQPVAGRVVLGWDPAFRTGCKLAVVDPTGKVLDTAVIYPTAPQNKVREAEAVLERLIAKHGITLFSVGNGTASRESEQVITGFFKKTGKPLQYVIVNEAGASVYSASKLATEEFPQFDVGQRSAASIARRLQDPLAELVKIDPRAIGVGQYQHDMNQKKLETALSGVVEKCVNAVGVDLNTASAPLLSHISGVSASVARNIVAWREENGAFAERSQLRKVKGLGPKAYEQCAGFLRIRGGKNPLDNTAVHPESYAAVQTLAQLLQVPMETSALRRMRTMVPDTAAAARRLGVGEITLRDILAELEKPGRDPRQDMPAPVLRSDVLSMEDLSPGMKLKGTVRNIVDFGAFVDIGVHQDGLVHISKLSRRFIKHPLEAVSVGDIVEVTVLSVDIKKRRISLSMV